MDIINVESQKEKIKNKKLFVKCRKSIIIYKIKKKYIFISFPFIYIHIKEIINHKGIMKKKKGR